MKICTEIGCGNKSHAKGLCNTHYMRFRKSGVTGVTGVTSEFGEVWRDFVENNNGAFKISNFGRVKKIKGVFEYLVKPYSSKRHIGVIHFCANRHVYRLSYMVAKYFIPNNYSNKRVVHIDGKNENCRADNIMWLSEFQRDNSMESLRHQADNGCAEARSCLKYMHGNAQALNSIIASLTTKTLRYLRYLYSFYVQSYGISANIDLESVVQDSMVKFCSAVYRGLLNDASKLMAYLKVLARRTMIDSGKKELFSMSMFAVNSNGDEFNLIDVSPVNNT